jgi:hypothetical protein
MKLQPSDLFAPVSEADEAIRDLRQGIKETYAHARKPAPGWVDDDRDTGWSGHPGERFGHATLMMNYADPSDMSAVRLTHIFRGNEYTYCVLGAGTDPTSHIDEFLANVRVPITAIRIYDGDVLREERKLQMRGA